MPTTNVELTTAWAKIADAADAAVTVEATSSIAWEIAATTGAAPAEILKGHLVMD